VSWTYGWDVPVCPALSFLVVALTESAGTTQHTVQVADFGLSTAFAIAAGGGGDVMAGDGSGGSSSVRRLRSVVGSPHYVAP